MPLLPYLPVCDWVSTMCCIVFRVQKGIFICVSLKSFVIFLVSSPLYVKVVNFVSRCCEFTFCSCELGCFVTWFILYSLCCTIYFMMFNSFFFASFVIGCVCNQFGRYLIHYIICSYG
jgi:hypothetical protein